MCSPVGATLCVVDPSPNEPGARRKLDQQIKVALQRRDLLQWKSWHHPSIPETSRNTDKRLASDTALRPAKRLSRRTRPSLNLCVLTLPRPNRAQSARCPSEPTSWSS